MQKMIFRFYLLFFAISCLTISFGTSEAYAYVDCNIASVVKVGPGVSGSSSNVIVILQNKTTSTVGTWGVNVTRLFQLHGSISNQGLAVLLTAQSLNKAVSVRVAGDASPYSLISNIYVNK